MNKKNEIVYEIVQSDILKICIALLSSFTILLVVGFYNSFNSGSNSWMYENVLPWLAIGDNGIQNVVKPWKVFTYMFTELSFMSLLSSCIWLIFFGFIIHDLKGKNSLVALFFTNGIILGVIAIIISFIFPAWLSNNYLYGMGTVLLSVVAATVVFNPTYKVLTFFRGGFSVWIIGVVYLLLHFSNLYGSKFYFTISLVAILLGLSYHYLGNTFYYSIQSFLNKDFKNLFDNKRFSESKRNKSAINTFYKKTEVTEKKLNEILDKIGKTGIDSLTKQEKEWLESSSKKID